MRFDRTSPMAKPLRQATRIELCARSTNTISMLTPFCSSDTANVCLNRWMWAFGARARAKTF